jgi:hypothetical protein
MILTKYVSIYISRRNINYYKKLGYDVNMFTFQNILIENLPQYCKTEIDAVCDNCGKIRKMKYFEYKRYKEKYLCRKCAEIKRKETSLKNWGVDNPSKNKIVKDKISKTIKELKKGIK